MFPSHVFRRYAKHEILFPNHLSEWYINMETLFSSLVFKRWRKQRHCLLAKIPQYRHPRNHRLVRIDNFLMLFYLGDCETDWVEFRENCYQVNEEIMNFKFAQEYCNSLHSQVVNIQTMSENIFIRNLTNNAGIPGYLWIGVHKVCLNCSRTIDGYTNWAAGQPNGVSKCVMMDSGGQWHDFDCGYKFAFVCEKGWFVL